MDIGCGTGAFSRLLARQAERVMGLDLSPEMIRVARERSVGFSNIEYQVADATAWEYPAGRFDCVASIATMHHLPLKETLAKVRETLAPGGALVVIDLLKSSSLADYLLAGVAMPVNVALRLLKTGRLRQSAAARAAWALHRPHDSYLTLDEVREICASELPGARVRRHLLWRYSVVWEK